MDISSYAALTKKQDWRGVCDLNQVPFDTFGTKKELKVLHEYLETDEVVLAICSGTVTGGINANAFDNGLSTWIVALTNERFLFLDHALLSKSVDTQSVRHDKVQAVSASQGWVLGKIMIDIGARVITVDNAQKPAVAAMADLANKWMREREKGVPHISATSPPPLPVAAQDDLMAKLERLASLRERGLLDDAEFKAAKAKLLDLTS